MADTIPTGTICASCADPIEGPWKTSADGRIFHEECPVTEREDTEHPLPGRGLGEKAERVARKILNPGQETLDG